MWWNLEDSTWPTPTLGISFIGRKTTRKSSRLKLRTSWLFEWTDQSWGNILLLTNVESFGTNYGLLNTPPKIHNFLWKAYSDILPTRANCRPYLMGMPICSQCLALARGKIQKSSSEALNFYLLAITMVDRLAVKELELWAMISWSLWNPKNRLFSLKSQPAVILRGATSLLEEYQWLALAGPHRWDSRLSFF